MNRVPFAFALVAASAIAGCVTVAGTVKTRAAHDFTCTEEQVSVINIGGTSFEASGCGQKGTYTCAQASAQGGIACVREADPTPKAAAPPPVAPANPAAAQQPAAH